MKQTMNGVKRSKGKSHAKKSKQKRDTETIKVPFFAESNLGIIHRSRNEELFEQTEKKDQILRMQKRAAAPGKNWDVFHGKGSEKNSILNLIRSAAGKKSGNILGLNSKSFDIFPGPLPEESNLGKASTEPPQQQSYAQQKPSIRQSLRQSALASDHLYATPKHHFRQQVPQMIRIRPMSMFRRQPQQQYQAYATDNYKQPPQNLPAVRTVVRPKPIVINSPVQTLDYQSDQMQMPSRRYEQQYTTQQQQQQQQQQQPQEFYSSQPARTSRGNMIPMQTAAANLYADEYQEPIAAQNEYAPAINENSMRYSSYQTPRIESPPMTAMNIRRDLKSDQDLDLDQLQRDQENDLAQQQMLLDQDQSADTNSVGTTARQDLPSIPYMSNNLFRFPKGNEGQLMTRQYSTQQQAAAIEPIDGNTNILPFEDDASAVSAASPLRRRLVSSHIPQTPTEIPEQASLQPQYSQYASEQASPQTADSSASSTRHQVIKKPPDDDSFFDEEKPEVHVHVSTEKSRISRPSSKTDHR